MSATRAEVMLVEDDADLRLATQETLKLGGFTVLAFAEAASALTALSPEFPGIILSDLRMPGMSGLDFLDAVRARAPDVPFVLITAHGDVPAALRAMRAGAHDFLEKPCPPDLMLEILRRASEMRRLQLENARLREDLARAPLGADRLIGRSPALQDLRRRLPALAKLQVDLLITGETGTGKELVAQLLHDLSPRREAPFVAVNCGALSEAEVDRELFGSLDAPGLITRAEGGTLYLDALDAMPETLQVRLLRVLEAREITPLGAAPRPVDLRILGSVKPAPSELLQLGQLRGDLYHRFSGGALRLPPLRERGEDGLELVSHFAALAALRHGLPKPQINAQLRRRLARHDWPGNVREARTLAERLVIGLDVALAGGVTEASPLGYEAAMEGFEQRLLLAALGQTGGRKAEAAALLNIPRKRLYLRLRHHGLL